MCSISGFVSSHGSIDIHQYMGAFNTLEHRGPDDQGLALLQSDGIITHCYTDKTVPSKRNTTHINTVNTAIGILGHHRLSILDLSENGHQPYERDGCLLIYNGEIYNYKEIRKQLENSGYSFISNSDTEVVITAWLAYREQCFSMFNGMWALAIYDSAQRMLILSRDRFGIKPLYYSISNNTLVFASEIKFFYKLGYSTINETIAREYIKHQISDHGEQSFIKSVQHLEPGKYLKFCQATGSSSQFRYWELKNQLREKDLSDEEAIKTINELLTSAVSLRLRSDVGVGVMLSGVVDSTGLMAKMLAMTQHNHLLHSYSSIFADSQYSEHEDIQETLSGWTGRVLPHFVDYSSSDIEMYMETLLYHQDFPFRSLAVLSQFLLYRKVADDGQVTVLLNGQGADEVFGGYTNHLFANLASLLIRLEFPDFYAEAKSLKQWGSIGLILLIKKIAQSIKETTKYGFIYREFQGLYPLQSLLKKNLLFSALPEYLRYEDRNSMAFSRESRLPFLDYRLVEFLWQLDDSFKIRQGATKWALREVLKNELPAHIYSARIKRGFISPQEEWQRSGALRNWIAERDSKPTFMDYNEWKSISKKMHHDPWLHWRIALFNEWERGSYRK